MQGKCNCLPLGCELLASENIGLVEGRGVKKVGSFSEIWNPLNVPLLFTPRCVTRALFGAVAHPTGCAAKSRPKRADKLQNAHAPGVQEGREGLSHCE